jgi:predicted RNase H-like HicB family nuclease
MTYEVLIRKVEGHFTATVLGLPDCTAKAATRAEAIQLVQETAASLFSEGELVEIQLGSPSRICTLRDFAGMWTEDETFDEFTEAMKEYRREVDADQAQP